MLLRVLGWRGLGFRVYRQGSRLQGLVQWLQLLEQGNSQIQRGLVLFAEDSFPQKIPKLPYTGNVVFVLFLFGGGSSANLLVDNCIRLQAGGGRV